MLKKIILLAFLVFLPQITNAQVIITEIMYDLEGTDSDREWVEIYNGTNDAIDLTNYYFYESGVSHRLSGEGLLNPNQYAVIVDSVDKFLEDWSDYSGLIFDSSFALSNSGEELIIQDSQKNNLDSVSYNPDMGANGTGNSLQLIDGVFAPGSPTPGEENVSSPEDENNLDEEKGDDIADDISVHSGQDEITDFKPKSLIKTGIGRDRLITINTPIELEIKQSRKEKGKHYWNFGNGDRETGGSVDYVYKTPGAYNLIVNSYFDDQNTTARIKIHVYEPKLKVYQDKNMLIIENIDNTEVNLGEFKIKTGFEEKTILKDTIISKGQKYIFETKRKIDWFEFKYPNGKKYYTSNDMKAENFCGKVKELGGECKTETIKKIFDRI